MYINDDTLISVVFSLYFYIMSKLLSITSILFVYELQYTVLKMLILKVRIFRKVIMEYFVCRKLIHFPCTASGVYKASSSYVAPYYRAI